MLFLIELITPAKQGNDSKMSIVACRVWSMCGLVICCPTRVACPLSVLSVQTVDASTGGRWNRQEVTVMHGDVLSIVSVNL